jgi:hypothetical protein
MLYRSGLRGNPASDRIGSRAFDHVSLRSDAVKRDPSSEVFKMEHVAQSRDGEGM